MRTMEIGNSEWNRIEELYHAALELPAIERDAWLAAQSGYDTSTRREVASLLAALRKHEELSAQPRLAEAAEPGSPEPEPARFGPYQTIRLLGHGGMGAVYLAKRVDGQFDQLVALKVIAAHLGGAGLVRRFQTERQLLASLNHPNITRLLDGGVTSSGDPYLVMEYVEGRTLDRECDERKLGIEQRLRLFLQVLEAVDSAHRSLVLHRDLKPANILVTGASSGQPGAAKLLDFGTASLMAEGADLTLTRTRPFTPRYASPEELRGERATTASDIFSLGVILYELLTGAWPFGKPDSVAGELNRAFSNVPVKAPATVVTAEAAESRSLSLDHLGRLLRGDLPAIALKALEADPARRYGTARQFSDDIAAYLEGHPVQARPQTALYRARKFLGRRWLPVAAAAVFVAAVSVAAVVSVYEARMARAEALKAEKVNQFLNDMLSSGTGLRFDPERFTVADMLQAAEPLLLTRWKDDPLTKALLQRSLGASYTAIHRLDRGKAQLDSALAAFRVLADDREIAETLVWLSSNQVESGHLEEGVASLDEALWRVRRLGTGAPAPLAFSVRNQLASLLTLYLRRRLPECRMLLNEAIDLARHNSSIRRTDLAQAMTSLAGMLGEEGKFAEAEAMTREALAIGRTQDPGGGWEVAPLYELGILRSRQADAAGAAEFARERYDNMLRHLGADHLYTATSQVMWARGLAETGNVDEAIRQFEAAMPIILKAYHMPNPNLWTAEVSAAHIFIKAGQFSKAEPYARQALEIVDAEGLAEVDARRAESLYHIGAALHGEKRDGEAISVLQRSQAIYRQCPGFAKSVDRVQAMLIDAGAK